MQLRRECSGDAMDAVAVPVGIAAHLGAGIETTDQHASCHLQMPDRHSHLLFPSSSPTSARTANCSPSSDAAVVAMQIAIEE